MDIFRDIEPCRQAVQSARRADRTVGLVPTMGALHAGHLSLVRAAKDRCNTVALTIFVNPTQFGPGEDYEDYPRTWDDDQAACRAAGVDMIFAPTAATMYSDGDLTVVGIRRITERLCGAGRPGHFDGVATVVAKLFHILPADFAFFGEKDYQQLVVIKKMVADLKMSIHVVGCPIVREEDGLALSSRNRNLSPAERTKATSLSRALMAAQAAVVTGQRDPTRIVDGIRAELGKAGVTAVDYVEVVDPSTLAPVTRVDRPARICLAARIGACRLIDNIAVDPPARTE